MARNKKMGNKVEDVSFQEFCGKMQRAGYASGSQITIEPDPVDSERLRNR
jgi:hypothetical protein